MNFSRFDKAFAEDIWGNSMRKKGFTAFLLWLLCIVGVCGIHRFYVGRPMSALIWLFIFGLLGFGQLFDLLFLGSMVRQANMLDGLKFAGQGSNYNNNSNVNTVAPIFNVHVNVPGVTVATEPTKLT